MRRIVFIAAAVVPLAVCLCVLFASPPPPPQNCTTDGDKLNCNTYNFDGGTCYAEADCLDNAFEPCGFQHVYAGVSVPQGATCIAGTSHNRECGPQCGGGVFAKAVKKQQVLVEMESYCCNGCY